MIYFVLILILLSTLTILESFNKNLIPYGTGIVVFFILFLFAASRPIGADHDSEVYLSMYSIFDVPLDYFRNIGIWGFFEPLYYLIPSVLKHVFHVASYGMVTIYIYAFLACAIVMLAIRNLTDYYYAAILTLFCNFFLLHEMTQIRAAIAVGLFLFCIQFKENRQWTRFFVCAIISCLFHYSSLLAFSILFIPGKHLNKPLFLSLALLSLVLSFVDFSWVLGFLNFDAGALAEKQDLYVNEIQGQLFNRRNFIFLTHLANTILLIWFAGRIYKHNKYIYLLAKIQVAGLIFFQILAASPTISSRVAEYFLTTHIITLSATLYLFKYKFWPALALCLLNICILLTLIYRNQLFDLSYYS